MPSAGLVVANGDCEALDRVLEKGCWSRLERFNREGGWTVTPEGDVRFGGESFGCLAMNLPGRHNQLNALAAVAAARNGYVSTPAMFSSTEDVEEK